MAQVTILDGACSSDGTLAQGQEVEMDNAFLWRRIGGLRMDCAYRMLLVQGVNKWIGQS